jgi:hypothetical protein
MWIDARGGYLAWAVVCAAGARRWRRARTGSMCAGEPGRSPTAGGTHGLTPPRCVGMSAAAAGVSPMTVHRVLRGKQRTADQGRAAQRTSGRISASAAQRLLAVTPAMVAQVAARRDASGTRRRLQALVAVGHPRATLAHRLGIPPRTVTRIVRGTTATVSPDLHAAICALYERLWDVAPPGRTLAERKAAGAARTLAAGHGWPTPMGLDDERIDDPGYRPRVRWRPAVGVADSQCRCQRRSSTGASLPGTLSTDVNRLKPCRRPRCQSASARPPEGGH